MSTVSTPEPDLRKLARKTFRFDGLTALFLAFLLLSAIIVVWLSAVWVTNQVWKSDVPAIGVQILEIATDGLEGMAGDDPQLGENQMISASELPPRSEFQGSDDLNAPAILSGVVDAIAAHRDEFATPKRQQGQQSSGRPGAAGGTGREGTGEGSGTIPRYQRWQILYDQQQTLVAYARQLDFFGIELGIVRGGQDVVLLGNLAAPRPVIKRAGVNDERLFFVWKDAGRRDADLQLVKKSGLPIENVVIAQFFPPKLEDELARMEMTFARKKPEEIRMTQFGIRQSPRGFEFHVVRQTLHK